MKTRYDPPQVSHPYDIVMQKTLDPLVAVVCHIPFCEEAKAKYAKVQEQPHLTVLVTLTRGKIGGCQRCRPSFPRNERRARSGTRGWRERNLWDKVYDGTPPGRGPAAGCGLGQLQFCPSAVRLHATHLSKDNSMRARGRRRFASESGHRICGTPWSTGGVLRRFLYL
jgi:hypothetical protein